MSATSPWLSTTSSADDSPNAISNNELDPWAAIETGYLCPSASMEQQQQLRSRKSSPAFNSSRSARSNAQPVDRHPLRSPSPAQGACNFAPREPGKRGPSAVASEWKAIGAGLAGLFGGPSSSNALSSNASSCSYRWPADPATTPVAGTLDRLQDWFGLKDEQQQQQQRSSSSRNPDGDQEVRVLIHPVTPTDTLSSLALHYGADIQVLRKSNKLWPGDPVQMRKLIYIPVESCKHRPRNAEIKVMPTRGGAVSSAESLASVRVNDPISDFMPDTNKAYTDCTPQLSGFVPRGQAVHVAKVAADQLRFFASNHRNSPPELGGDVSSSNASRFDDDDDDQWKANTWHFGGASTMSRSQHRHNHSSNVRVHAADRDESPHHRSSRWNEAPPPHAIVAEAYDGGKAHQRRRAQKSHPLLYDLAAGLPANTGAASKWARPIQFGDSLPDGRSGASISGRGGAKAGGIAKLIDDTIRGRISVEAALQGALQGVTANTLQPTQQRQEQQHRNRTDAVGSAKDD
ncbi:uncharacterized protein UHOD_03020 [Ustilago sp. UG-2017b]|nr:uncharacterized protein UHOD_03020 [Ustilago sp. UG-2017b]